jgi:hypothetical protein
VTQCGKALTFIKNKAWDGSIDYLTKINVLFPLMEVL